MAEEQEEFGIIKKVEREKVGALDGVLLGFRGKATRQVFAHDEVMWISLGLARNLGFITEEQIEPIARGPFSHKEVESLFKGVKIDITITGLEDRRIKLKKEPVKKPELGRKAA